ncbi:MAG: bifunctional methylenetetrahydrofolate dehydrogenase/methenyltetrahydrofolate cyclohydrolase FolD [candidate division Zixibacteria bacterium]|nr:bifunctional methylenetetrahydrofolate dehydrogenase/methenyltetrahydrofolate cyclohydrolase FolD [candidate division Zixibacteria bacterium]
MATIIDGKSVSKEIREKLKNVVSGMSGRGVTPGLAAVLIGNNPASETYVSAKAKACAAAGIFSEVIRRDAGVSQTELEDLVGSLNRRTDIDGILVQSPLPSGLDEQKITLIIDPSKDVDGFHPYNVGAVSLGMPAPKPCTPAGILELLHYYGIETSGAEVVVVGRSNIVGRPLANLLSQKSERGNATVTLAHSRTKNLSDVCRRADILIAALGRPGLVTADFVKPGAVVIDVGVNRIEDASRKSGYRLAGDVDFEAVSQIASYITPVPGGVGPMTIAMLLSNTVFLAKRRL